MPNSTWPVRCTEAALPSLAERQQGFAHAVLNADRPVPSGVAGPMGSVRDERFAVYRNNVAVGLIEALRSTFPVVNRLVGDAFFGAAAGVHALARPPATPILLAYGSEFPAFLEEFEPARTLPYLADVARLEWLWLESYHAADEEPLAAEDLASAETDRLPGMRLVLHPAVRIARFEHPAHTIWRAHQGDDDAMELDMADGPEAVLLVRPSANVKTVVLTPGGYAFLDAVRSGRSIAGAAEDALDAEAELELAELLALLFAAGAFASAEHPRTTVIEDRGVLP